MHSSDEIPPSVSANWLCEIIFRTRSMRACMKPNCTTCGATPFRKALWSSAAAVSPDGAAQAIVDQLSNLAPPLDVEAVQFVLWDLDRAIGSARISGFSSHFASSPAGEVYRRMLAHEERIRARRREHELRNDPAEVERRRGEKKHEKAQLHQLRLVAKALRDAGPAEKQMIPTF